MYISRQIAFKIIGFSTGLCIRDGHDKCLEVKILFGILSTLLAKFVLITNLIHFVQRETFSLYY